MYEKNSTESIDFEMILRSSVYLFLSFILGSIYFTVFITGLTLGLTLLIVLIGIPIIMLTNRITRGMAYFDRRMMAILMSEDSPVLPDDVEPLSTFQSYAYLTGKFIIGTIGITLLSMLMPLFILELLIMAFGVNTGMITGRVAYAMAVAFNSIGLPSAQRAVSVPTEKRKYYDDNPFYEDDEPDIVYVLDDDGEIRTARRN